MRGVLPVHGRDSHRPNGPDPIPATYAIKLAADDATFTAGTIFVWFCPADVSHTHLRDIEMFVSTTGSSETRLQLTNATTSTDLLLTPVEIDSGDYHSDDATTQVEIDDSGEPPANLVTWKDRLEFVVEAAGTGAMGLAVELKFGPNRVFLTP